MGLLLRVVDVKDRHHWRWLLVDQASGEPRADHTVALDPPAREVQAFEDLHRFLRWNADPQRRAGSEAQLLDQIGTWLGRAVLGEPVGRAIAAAGGTVRVQVPPAAGFLLYRPLELAYVAGVPLARHGVSLVYELGEPRPGKQPVAGDRLRMMALFSLPTAATALGLRRERYALTRLIDRLTARSGRSISLEVLQYGVTRDRLADAMAADPGPDVLHLSGHGSVGELLLEHPDGTPDRVPAAELLKLLAPARHRVKLAMVSACESAAGRVAETLNLLGFADAAAAAE